MIKSIPKTFRIPEKPRKEKQPDPESKPARKNKKPDRKGSRRIIDTYA